MFNPPAINMYDKEIEVLTQLAEAKNIIRKKFNALKNERHALEQNVSDTFQPIIKPLTKMAEKQDDESAISIPKKKTKIHFSTPKESRFAPRENAETSNAASFDNDHNLFDNIQDDDDDNSHASFSTIYNTVVGDNSLDNKDNNSTISNAIDVSKEQEKNLPQVAESYVKLAKNRETGWDRKFGVRAMAKGDLKIGDSYITFTSENIQVGNKEYPMTQGLMELLFKSMPNNQLISETDKDSYATIVADTNLLRKNFEPDRSFKKDVSPKFRDYIEPVMKKITGSGLRKTVKLPTYMTSHQSSRSIDYIYWDDPNELCNRLKLLLSEKTAGNNNHDNEIHSIIEELREFGVIY